MPSQPDFYSHGVDNVILWKDDFFFSRLVFFIKQPLIPRYKRKLSPSEIQHQISACWGEWGGEEVPPYQQAVVQHQQGTL